MKKDLFESGLSIEKFVKRVNSRLYELEKAGIDHRSAWYSEMKNFIDENNLAAGQKNRLSITKARAFGLGSLKKSMGKSTNLETSLVSGTKKRFEKSYEKFKKNAKVIKKFQSLGRTITPEEYDKVTREWHKLNENKKEHYGSDVLIEVAERLVNGEVSLDYLDEVFNRIDEQEELFKAKDELIRANGLDAILAKFKTYT